MAEQGFNFQALVRQLGLKNVDELPIIRALTPVISFGDGQELTAPLLPPTAWSGGARAGVALRFGYLQLRSLGGGCWIKSLKMAGSTRFQARIDLDGTDPLAASPIADVPEIFNVGSTPVESLFLIGTSTVAINSLLGFFGQTALLSWDLNFKWFLPMGALLTVGQNITAQQMDCSLLWSEVPSPALTPTG